MESFFTSIIDNDNKRRLRHQRSKSDALLDYSKSNSTRRHSHRVSEDFKAFCDSNRLPRWDLTGPYSNDKVQPERDSRRHSKDFRDFARKNRRGQLSIQEQEAVVLSPPQSTLNSQSFQIFEDSVTLPTDHKSKRQSLQIPDETPTTSLTGEHNRRYSLQLPQEQISPSPTVRLQNRHSWRIASSQVASSRTRPHFHKPQALPRQDTSLDENNPQQGTLRLDFRFPPPDPYNSDLYLAGDASCTPEPEHINMPGRKREPHEEVYTSQPPMYWCGRIMSANDRQLNETLEVDGPHESCRDEFEVGPKGREMRRMRGIFVYLQECCMNESALESLKEFQINYALKTDIPSLSPHNVDSWLRSENRPFPFLPSSVSASLLTSKFAISPKPRAPSRITAQKPEAPDPFAATSTTARRLGIPSLSNNRLAHLRTPSTIVENPRTASTSTTREVLQPPPDSHYLYKNPSRTPQPSPRPRLEHSSTTPNIRPPELRGTGSPWQGLPHSNTSSTLLLPPRTSQDEPDIELQAQWLKRGLSVPNVTKLGLREAGLKESVSSGNNATGRKDNVAGTAGRKNGLGSMIPKRLGSGVGALRGIVEESPGNRNGRSGRDSGKENFAVRAVEGGGSSRLSGRRAMDSASIREGLEGKEVVEENPVAVAMRLPVRKTSFFEKFFGRKAS